MNVNRCSMQSQARDEEKGDDVVELMSMMMIVMMRVEVESERERAGESHGYFLLLVLVIALVLKRMNTQKNSRIAI